MGVYEIHFRTEEKMTRMSSLDATPQSRTRLYTVLKNSYDRKRVNLWPRSSRGTPYVSHTCRHATSLETTQLSPPISDHAVDLSGKSVRRLTRFNVSISIVNTFSCRRIVSKCV